MIRDLPFVLQGGLNLAGVTLGLKNGEATLLENYVPNELGGYRRFAGYEPYDGRIEPQNATYKTIPFTTGLAAGIAVGNTVTGLTSSATAKVIAISITSGSFATNDAAGVLVVTSNTITGIFSTTEALRVSGTTRATKSAVIEDATLLNDAHDAWIVLAQTDIRAPITAPAGEGPIRGVFVHNGIVYAFKNAVGGATCVMHQSSASGWAAAKTGLAASGSYEFVEHNFKGSSTTRSVYGVSGTHRAFQWDGTTWTDITTGMSSDTPRRIAERANYLFLGFANGSLQNSPVGDPTGTWTLRTGAAEFGIGDDINALLATRGGVLAIYCRRLTRVLYGSGVSTWDLRPLSDTNGAYPRTVQDTPMGPLALDESGLKPLTASDSFGDFESTTISQKVGKLLEARRGLATCSCVLQNGSQYRVFFSDGTVLCLTFNGSRMAGYSLLRLPISPTCCWAGRDAQGNEMLIVGAQDGNVYRFDVGFSLAGAAIDCYVRTGPLSPAGVRGECHFQKVALQIQTSRQLNMLVQAEYDYQLSPADVSRAIATDVSASPSSWDIGNWDEMTWDSGDERPGIVNPEVRLDGRGMNVSLLLYHGVEIKPPFTLESGVLLYRPVYLRK